MRDIPDYYWEWTEYDDNTGMRLVKSNVPINILKKLVADERYEFEMTWRRNLINIDLDTGEIISTEEAVRLYNEFEKQKIEILRQRMKLNKEESERNSEKRREK